TAPRIGPALILARYARHVRITISVSGTHGCLSIALWIPRQASAWIEMRPLLVDAVCAGESGIAGEIEAVRRIHEYGALLRRARDKPIHGEVRDLTVANGHRQIRLPANAEVESEARRDSPAIRRIKIEKILAARRSVRQTLEEAAGRA